MWSHFQAEMFVLFPSIFQRGSREEKLVTNRIHVTPLDGEQLFFFPKSERKTKREGFRQRRTRTDFALSTDCGKSSTSHRKWRLQTSARQKPQIETTAFFCRGDGSAAPNINPQDDPALKSFPSRPDQSRATSSHLVSDLRDDSGFEAGMRS